MRHFDWSKYRRKGVKDITNLDDYVETIVRLVDNRNEQQEVDGWREEQLHRELIQFSDYLLKILKEVAYRDAEEFLRQSERIKSLEMTLGIRKKPSPVKPKEPTQKDKDEIEKIAKLIK